MKGFMKKLVSVLVIVMMFVNSSLLSVISVAIDEVERIVDKSKINALYELNMEKYVNYEIGEQKGLMVQTSLKNGIEYQERQEYMPIKTAKTTINAPKVNEEYPEKVEIVVKSTKLTNGDENGKDVDYSYNAENGELQIVTENKTDDDGNVYSEKVESAVDEYQLNFYYGSNCYDANNVDRTLEFSGKEELVLNSDQ